MKVAVVHNIPIHYKHLLFQAMNKLGMNFDVLFMASGSSIRHEDIGLSQDLYRYRIGYDGPYESAPPVRKALWTWSALKEIRPRVILVSSYYATECWSAWLWAFLNRVPLVMWYESNEFDYPRHWPKELLKRIFIRGLAGAHVYGLSNKAYLVKLGLPTQDVTIKRAVVDIGKFDTKPSEKSYRSDGVTRLVYVGRLAAIKNVITLVRAFADAVKSTTAPMRLIIAGTGPCQEALRNEASMLGVGELIDFRGYIPQKDLAAVYREADFFVLPSVREPWGLVALEAMLCRLPVLISTQCGCALDVVNSETGWSFSPWDQANLAALIKQLPAVRLDQIERMGAAAHDLAAVYSPDNCARLVFESVRNLRNRSSRVGACMEAGYVG